MLFRLGAGYLFFNIADAAVTCSKIRNWKIAQCFVTMMILLASYKLGYMLTNDEYAIFPWMASGVKSATSSTWKMWHLGGSFHFIKYYSQDDFRYLDAANFVIFWLTICLSLMSLGELSPGTAFSMNFGVISFLFGLLPYLIVKFTKNVNVARCNQEIASRYALGYVLTIEIPILFEIGALIFTVLKKIF